MAETPSIMLKLGTAMPEFELQDFDGKVHRSREYDQKPVLVIFMCNHCPFVKHIADVLATRAREFEQEGVAVVGINSNDAVSQPADSPEKMKEFAAERGISFPYLYDEDQLVARSFNAACTPDIFLFDREHRLVYRGQFDDSRPSNGKPVTGDDLARAVDALVSGKPVPQEQKASLGCNIKWKAGNAPAYFTMG